MYNLTKDFYSK